MEKELDREELTNDERKEIINHLIELDNKADNKDSENKQFLSKLSKDHLLGAGFLVVAGLVFVGGKINIEKN